MTDRRSQSTPRQMLGVMFTLLLAIIPISISGCPAASSPTTSITADSDGKGNQKPDHPPQIIPSISRPRVVEPKVALPLPDLPREPLHEPKVLLSDEHRRTCLVQVGDRMPDISLPDCDGQVRHLPDLYGERLTVVVFWNDRKIFAREQFSRLGHDTDHFRTFGVSVVAINVGDSPELVTQMRQQYPGGFQCLVDEQGEAMAHVATNKLPRTYLLDAEGRIVWLDIEFSRATERELQNAVYWHLLPDGQRYLPAAGVPIVPASAGANVSG